MDWKLYTGSNTQLKNLYSLGIEYHVSGINAIDRYCSFTGSGINFEKKLGSGPSEGGVLSKFMGITIEKSLEFSYNELAEATGNFSLANKIGQGGFGSVYYAELRGEVSAYAIYLKILCLCLNLMIFNQKGLLSGKLKFTLLF